MQDLDTLAFHPLNAGKKKHSEYPIKAQGRPCTAGMGDAG